MRNENSKLLLYSPIIECEKINPYPNRIKVLAFTGQDILCQPDSKNQRQKGIFGNLAKGSIPLLLQITLVLL